jgi:DNA-binding beta-propeller fold protein YncE
MRKRSSVIIGTALGLSLAMLGSAAMAESQSKVMIKPKAAHSFAKLPEGVRYPEGITANPETGDIIVGTFDFGPNLNQLLRFNRKGKLAAQKDFGGTPLLGLAFNHIDGKVYIANFGMSQIQRIDADFSGDSETETVAQVPALGAPEQRFEANPDGSEDIVTFGSNSFPGPNALTFADDGTLYISDSFQGAVYRVRDAADCATPCSVETLVHDPLLATPGFPPFGANGVALNADESILFVANTGDDRVLQVNLADQTVSVFAEGLNGADGLALDADGTLWVAANQADQILGLNSEGRVIAKLGEHRGIKESGATKGLLFPASLVINDNKMYITNLALPLTPASGDEPEEDVSQFTVSKIKLRR